jgi:Na+/H+ antiporter NhaD/arsenite permease-like protein
MFILMVVLFILGYLTIALEHPLKIDKTVPALMIGSLMWVLYIFGAFDIFSSGFSDAWNTYVQQGHSGLQSAGTETMRRFIVEHEVLHHMGEIAGILFFLFGAMTIVEVIDKHEGFRVITDRISTTGKVKLLWIISFLTFFLSAVLDNLTTTIVMVALLRKLIQEKETKWFFASMVVLAANAGGAWSPIGDVTTIMLWIGGQVTTGSIIARVFIPSLITMVVPLLVLSFTMKGKVERPETDGKERILTTPFEQKLLLIMGIAGLLFVPVFKSVTHLPPYLGMLFSLSVLWLTTEFLHMRKPEDVKKRLRVFHVIKHVDTPTIFFFLGILLAVASLQSAGQLQMLAHWLDENLGSIFLIDIAIGLLSAVVDNVPLVAGAMGMYPIEEAASIAALADPAAMEYAQNFLQDGLFWEFLAYCAGTGGSILIIGSAAGVAAMGMERIDFIWYLKRISLLALLGYLAGAGAYYLETRLFS